MNFRSTSLEFRKRTVTLFLGSAAVAVGVVACNGGSSVTPSLGGSAANSSRLLQINHTQNATASGTARIVITVPPRQAKDEGRLHVRYVSPDTESMVVETWSGTKQTFNLWPGSPGCTKNQSTGELTCTKKIALPAGSQTLVVTLYDASKAKGLGAALSTVTTKVKVVAGKTMTLSLVTEGIPASATVLLGNPAAATVVVPQGTATSVPMSINAYDAKGNLIVPPGNYSTPIACADSDTTGATKLSKTTIKAPDASLTLSYDGSKAFTGATITPSIGGNAQSAGAATVSVNVPTIVEYSVPSGAFVPGITAGPDGAMWFTENNTSDIGRISTNGAVTEYSAPQANRGIVAGPDRALWYAASNAIVRLTTSGTVTEYSLPSGADNVGSSWTLGRNGALWTTGYRLAVGYDTLGYQQATIADITTTGTVTAYALATPSPIPSTPPNSPYYTFTNNTTSITTGSDGALWFTGTIQEWTSGANPAQVSANVSRMTTAGVVTAQYPVSGGSASAFIGSVTNGPDGALWFTYGGSVDRMTTTGTVTTYKPTGTAQNIVSGPDGALWFTECGGAYIIGRITTAGAITEYSGPSASSSALNIAAGPDNAVWFTDPCNSEIGRVPVAIAASDIHRRKSTRGR